MIKGCTLDNFLKSSAVLIFVCAYALCCPLPCSAYDEDAGDDDPQAMQVTGALSESKAKSPAVVIMKTRESLMPRPILPSGNTMIKEVSITGSTILAQEAIDTLKADYSGREFTAKQLQRCADLINRAYSREGYISSYAYIVPDRLASGILDIIVVEGKTGKITIQGNKNFSTSLLEKKISLKQGDLFNFKQLNSDVFRMNKVPDRKAAVTLEPDPVTGDINVVLTVKDRSPMHVTLQADNYGSDSILYNRYKTFLTHNNISGHDDTLTAKVEWAEADAHKIVDFDYSIPLNQTWKFQFYLLPYKSEDYYYKDNEPDDFEKRARKFYFWFYQSLVNEPEMELVSSYGFTYFDILWYKFGDPMKYSDPSKRDEFRILKWDLALNKADKHGRWVITNDLQKAIPDFMGGTPKKSDTTSVDGAKGDYIKNMLTVARRQKLFAGIDLTAKTRWQVTSATLTGVNAFSMGGYNGVIDNRGYPRTQFPADNGHALNMGLEFPLYFVPRTMNAPFSLKTKLYDSFRWFTFWDWAYGSLKSPKDGVDKSEALMSAGIGFKYTVPDQNLAVRLDCGFPLSPDEVPVDGDNTHTWFSVTKGF
jgi:hemolysin activation/secretion protein